MKGSLLWNENTKVFDDLDQPNGKTITAAQQTVDALGADRYGMALAGMRTENPNVKLVAISRGDGWTLDSTSSLATVSDRSYPFSRSVWIYINRGPGEAIDPKVKEFLRYILSRNGQDDVDPRGGSTCPLHRP